MTKRKNITEAQMSKLTAAFAFFNDRLLGGKCPEVMIVQTNHPGAAGYYRPEGAWADRDGNRYGEISICPAILDRSDYYILQTVLHEMCHAVQFAEGTESRRGYHNKRFAEIMESAGLICSTTGQPGGKKVGQRMSDYFEKGGKFEKTADAFIEKHGSFEYHEGIGRVGGKVPPKGEEGGATEGAEAEGAGEDKPKDRTKVKHHCPACFERDSRKGQYPVVWGKAGLRIRCAAEKPDGGECGELLVEVE